MQIAMNAKELQEVVQSHLKSQGITLNGNAKYEFKDGCNITINPTAKTNKRKSAETDVEEPVVEPQEVEENTQEEEYTEEEDIPFDGYKPNSNAIFKNSVFG